MPQRYSRHYYDLYRMAQTSVKDVAFSYIDLLKTVVDFKMKFYPRAWAKYPEAIPGTLKLIPPEYRFPALISNYEAMKDMLYGDVPSFDTIMETNKQSTVYSTERPLLNASPPGGWRKLQSGIPPAIAEIAVWCTLRDCSCSY